jgi:ketopantoate reductase
VSSDRLVLIQNGWIRPLLHDLPNITRGLIWFTAKGEYFQILRPNRFSGLHAADLSLALAAGGLPSEATDLAVFAGFDAEKMGFNCVVGLPLAVHGLSLGEYLARYPDEAEVVFEEATTACSVASGANPPIDGWEAFLESAEHLDWVRVTEAKAIGFRNGAVVALAAEHGLQAPVNSNLLRHYGSMCATKANRDLVS